MSNQIVHVEWNSVVDWLRVLVDKIEPPNLIIGVARSGCPIAVAASYLFDSVPVTFAVKKKIVPKTSNYVAPTSAHDHIDTAASNFELLLSSQPKSILLIDDVATTGGTLLAIKAKLQQQCPSARVEYACFAVDPQRIAETLPLLEGRLHYCRTIDNAKVWLTFPWIVTRGT